MALSEDYIKNLTWPEYFTRGEEYWQQGRVSSLAITGDQLQAFVNGNNKYIVSGDLSTLDFSCTCPAYKPLTVCKHVIAVLLAHVRGARQSEFHNKNPMSVKPKFAKAKTPTDASIDKIWNELRSGARDMDRRFGRDWDDYSDTQDLLLDRVCYQLSGIKVDRETAQDLLKIAEWIDKHLLGEFDDSNGTLGDMQYEILAKSTEFLNPSKNPNDLKIYWQYTRKEYDFNMAYDIINAIFSTVNNDQIVRFVGKKLEKACKTPDPDFNFRPESLISSWCKYLMDHHSPDFETTSLKYPDDYEVLALLFEYWLSQRQYSKLIEYGYPNRHNYRLERLYEEALKKSGNFTKLTEFYAEVVEKHPSLDNLRQLKETCLKNQNSDVWTNISNKLKHKLTGENLADLLMLNKDYQGAAYALITRPDNNYHPDNTEIYAKKLTVLDPVSAIVVYKYLIDREIKKFTTSNFYPRFVQYMEILKSLHAKSEIREIIGNLRNNFPTKRKLMEILNNFESGIR